MTIIDTRLDDLNAYVTLAGGQHDSPDDGMCLIEAAAWIAGEPFSDHPECVCPVLAAFGRSWNDSLDTETRNRLLKPFVSRLVGTRSTRAVRNARAFLATDWLVRAYTPAWLRAIGLDDDAAALEALPALTSNARCRSAMPTIKQAQANARAAWAAAWAAARAAARAAAGDAAGDAAWAAAGDAARDAARAVAGAAAGAAAGDAAWDAAWAAAGDAAGDAAWDAAGAAAWDAARDAAWAAARAAAGDAAGAAAWDAAWDAAGERLAPTVAHLQTSAVDLFDRMIQLTEVAR